MNCLRCGRETENQNVFCPQCMEKMAREPVKADAVVHLPVRKSPALPHKTHTKPKISPEEQIALLRRRTSRLAISLTVFVLLLGLAVAALFCLPRLAQKSGLGQNYKTSVSEPSGTGA